jgi:hypothetical protein
MSEIVRSQCADCGVSMDSSSQYCVLCYVEHTAVCPVCRIITSKGRVTKRKHYNNGEPIIRCENCGGAGWLLDGHIMPGYEL